MTFHGKPRCDEKTLAHVHEAPPIMWVPLVVLAVGSVIAGAIGYHAFVGEGMNEFWGKSIFVLSQHSALAEAHHVPTWVKLLPLVFGLAGIAIAYLMYVVQPGLPAKLAKRLRPLYLFSFNKWYFDELYDRVFVRTAFVLGLGFWKSGDGAVIDGVGPDGVASVTRQLARRASRLQTGYVYHYAFAMLIGVVVLVSWYMYQQAGS